MRRSSFDGVAAGGKQGESFADFVFEYAECCAQFDEVREEWNPEFRRPG